MLRFAVLCVMVALCAAQSKSQFAGGLDYNAGNMQILPALPIDVAPPSQILPSGSMEMIGENFNLQAPVPMEIAQPAAGVAVTNWGAETINFPAPATGLAAPSIHLPKGSQEVVDIPHAAMPMPGNSIQNKDLHLNLPSPTIEAPNPIIRKKDVLFRLPQPIFYVPNPIVQHKPIVHRVPHTLRTITPRVNLQAFLFKVPSAQITGKSGY